MQMIFKPREGRQREAEESRPVARPSNLSENFTSDNISKKNRNRRIRMSSCEQESEISYYTDQATAFGLTERHFAQKSSKIMITPTPAPMLTTNTSRSKRKPRAHPASILRAKNLTSKCLLTERPLRSQIFCNKNIGSIGGVQMWALLLWSMMAMFGWPTSRTSLIQVAECAKLPDIYWNSSNPIFRIDNTDHIFDVNKKQHDQDQVDFVCPSAPDARPNANNGTNDQERYLIYSVSKEEYDTCRVNGNARIVALCDQQTAKNRARVTVTFRSFTPQPNGLEFRAGQDYYFISALSGQVDGQRRFSPCREHNMKVIFKVCCKSSASPQSQSQAQPQAQTQTQTQTQSQPAANVSSTGGPTARAAQPSTRRPNVITLKPSLVVSQTPPQAKQISPLPLDDFMRSFNSGNQQQQIPEQPITVLPIEVLQPSSEQPPVSPTSGESSESSERNDIVQNEQQQPATSSSSHSARAFQTPAFIPFDPRAAPEVIRSEYGRWAPTPLPAQLTNKIHRPTATGPPAYPHLEPAPWQLPSNQLRNQLPPTGPNSQIGNHNHNNNNQMRLSQSPGAFQPSDPQMPPRPSGPSRINLYPHAVWSSYDQTAGQRDSGQEQPSGTSGSSESNGNSSAAWSLGGSWLLVVPVMAIVLLVHLQRLRRTRARLAHQQVNALHLGA